LYSPWSWRQRRPSKRCYPTQKFTASQPNMLTWKILYTFLIFPIRATWPDYLILLDFSPYIFLYLLTYKIMSQESLALFMIYLPVMYVSYWLITCTR
jgi:hypothetical protein